MSDTQLLMLLYNRVGKGTYWRAVGFAQALLPLGYQVTIVAVASRQWRGFREQALAPGLSLVESPDLLPSSGYDLWDVVNRLAWLRHRKFDLVHLFETRPVNIFPGLFVQRQQAIPLFTDWCDWFGRGGSVEERPNWLLRTALRPVETFFEEHFRPRADGTTVINRILHQKALALGVPDERLLSLPNGANVDSIQPQVKGVVRAKLGLPQDALILGYTGAMFVDDARLMAAAFNGVLAACPQARLLLIGYNNVAVEQWVNDPTAVLRTGSVTHAQLADYVAACDLGWLTLADNAANRGRFPMKVSDFMAAGCPLLVTDVGDLGWFVQQWQIGYVAKADSTAVVQTTLEAIAQPDQRHTSGQHARHIAETEFAWPVITSQLDQFYRHIQREF